MKDILNELIEQLHTRRTNYCTLKHKRGWLEYLDDGDLVFSPIELQETLRQIIDKKGKRPRGDRLFSLHRKTSFTVKEDKTPYRPEEALERFIIVSNSDNFYNQIPIGGGKESIDIGIKEDDSRFIFVELKPWRSSNSPLYAIVESLKNLVEYRIIHERKIKDIPAYKEVELYVLAPEEYYQSYRLIDEQKTYLKDKLSILKETLDNISSEFQTNIFLMALQQDLDSFLTVCKKLCEKNKITGQRTVSVSERDAIANLVKNKWKLLVSSG